jgi:hypothetical protein
VPLLVPICAKATGIKTERKCSQGSEVYNNNMQQRLGTIITHLNLFHICVPIYDALFLKTMYIVLCGCKGNEKFENNFWPLLG